MLKLTHLSSFLVVAFISLPSWGCYVTTDKNLTFQDLKNIIRDPSCEIKSIDDTIARLPETMRSRFALFYKSKSLQDPKRTNYEFPRAILSSALINKTQFTNNPQAALVLAFNGHELQAEHNSLEAVSMNPNAEEVFQYFDIKFPSDAEAKNLSWTEAQLKIKFSEPNPNRCVQCHGNPARPIYQAYPTWEGAFGSAHIKGLTEEVEQGLIKFINTAQSDSTSRYRHLNPNRMKTKPDCSFQEKDQKINDPICFDSARQTITIFQDLAVFNGIRSAKIIQAHPLFSNFKFAIAGAFQGCQNIPNFFPQKILNTLKQNMAKKIQYSKSEIDRRALSIYKKFIQESEFGDFGSLGSEQYAGPISDKTPEELIQNDRKYWADEFLFGLWVDTIEKQGPSRGIEDAVWLRLIFEGLGIEMKNWWMDLMQPTYRVNHGVAVNIHWYLEAVDQDLSPLTNERNKMSQNYSDPNSQEKAEKIYCAKLQENSLISLKKLNVPHISPVTLAPVSANQIFKNNCVSCHVDNPVGPFIPFDDEDSINLWLKKVTNLSKIKYRLFKAPELNQMPPTHNLTPKELEILESYLFQF